MRSTKKVILLFIVLGVWSCKNKIKETNTETPEPLVLQYTGPIIDMHVHAFSDPQEFGPLLGSDWNNPLTGTNITAPASLEEVKNETFEAFERYKIVKAMVSQGQLWYEEAPDKILIGNGHWRTPEELRELHRQDSLDVIGEVAPNYQGVLPTDQKLTAYFDLAEELDIPMAFHLFPGGPPGGAYFAYPLTRAYQAKPLQMEEILFSHPKMRIYIMHAGWPYLEDMKALMYAHPQVYVDTGVISWVLPRAEFLSFIEELVRAGFGKRIMYGSDQMIWPQTIGEGIEAINSSEILTLDQKADLFYNNAVRFLRLSKEEVSKHKNIAVNSP